MHTSLATSVSGLASEEAARRLAEDGPNELATAKRRTLLAQTWQVVREPMLLLLLFAGLINLVLAEPLDAVMLMGSAVVVIAISIYQERKTENALVALRDLSSPRALVLRDGRQMRIAGRDVVRGDAVLLSEGDRVPADAVLLEAVNISVDESALTGESVPVRKSPATAEQTSAPMGPPGGDSTPWVFSGTLVVKGHGVGVVRGTANDTELGRIGTALSTIESERTPLQREIDRLVRFFAVIGVTAAAAVVVIYGLTRGHWLEGVLAGVAAAMSLLPEEFPVVLTVFLALGAWRMSRRNVLTRRPPVVETLGSATVICVDKTGTLTLNSMTVRELVTGDETVEVTGDSLPERVLDLVEAAALASPVDAFDPMDKAFRDVAATYLAGTARDHDGWELVREYPLTEQTLALTHVWASPHEDRYVVGAKGAPETVADLCHFSHDQRSVLTDQVEQATAAGRRVLAVARAYPDRAGELPAEQHGFDFEYLGLATLQDPVRPGVAEAVAECASAGVRTVMITGDYPGTALAIAREIGLDHEAGVITGSELADLDDAELAQRVAEVSIYARMVPTHKLRLVRALKANGEVVAMTGDGVNDAPALRAADIGIAMGKRGTDVARESAGLVITDDDFTSIVDGVRQGRGIFDNLRKAMAYIVAVHIPIIGMSLVPLLATDWPLVMLPVQIALIELIIDPACSIVFEAEEVDPAIMEQQPRRLGEPVISRRILVIAVLQGLSVFAAVLGIYLSSVLADRPDSVTRSVTFATLLMGNLVLILVNRSWRLPVWKTFRERRNPTVKWILVVGIGVLTLMLVVPPVRDAFNFGPTTFRDWIFAAGAALLSVIWFEIYKAVTHPKTAGDR
ncbi:MAG: cation-translocating P-type ATPase [Nocardioides sp.]